MKTALNANYNQDALQDEALVKLIPTGGNLSVAAD